VSENEVVVTLDGRPRPATVLERGPERTLVRFRDAGTFRELWVPHADVVEVESSADRSKLYKLVVLGVLGAVGLALLLVPGGSDRRLSDVLPKATLTPTATASATASATPPAVAFHAVLFGDSFVSGRGLAKGQPTAVQLAAKELGWEAEVLGGDGTGFTTGGRRGGQPYAVRLRAVTTAPSLLLLQGGASDTGATPEQLTAAANAVLVDLARRFPTTRVVLLGPIAMEQPPDGQLVRVDATLRAVAKARKVSYLDPIALHWITAANGPGFTAATGFYPNAAGHASLGHQLAVALRSLLSS
jgi:lysophospholipase L1-like esterase